MYKRKYQERVKHANPRYDSALVSDLPKLGRGRELKNWDTGATATITNTTGGSGNLTWDGTVASSKRFMQFLPHYGIANGTGNGAKIGNKIFLKKLLFSLTTSEENYVVTGAMNDSKHADYAPYGLYIVLDTQNNSLPATSPYTDFLKDMSNADSNAIMGMQQVEKSRRFKVLYHKCGKMLPAQSHSSSASVDPGNYQRILETVELDLSGITLVYKDDITTTYSGLTTNAIYIWLILPQGNNVLSSTLTDVTSRVYYTDQ